MPKGYVSRAIKYAKDEKAAIAFLSKTRPDKQGFFRLKRGGLAKLKSITKEEKK